MELCLTTGVYFTPDDYFSNLIRDIDNATRVISMETYIFKLDTTGNAVLQALCRATDRGVRLQLLIDGIGSYRDASKIAEGLESINSEVRIFHPLPWDFALYRPAGRRSGGVGSCRQFQPGLVPQA